MVFKSKHEETIYSILDLKKKSLGQSGAVSVQLHMINAESRKYFKRAFSMSGSAYQLYVLRRFDRMKQIQNCTQINDTNEIIAFLKTANNSMLVNCNNNEWIPTIENSNAKAAFLTHTLDSIFNSVELSPKMDAMFSFASQVSQINRTETSIVLD